MSDPTAPLPTDPLPPFSSTYEAYRPVEVFVVEERRPKPRYLLYVLMLVLTMFTTLVVGARLQYNFANNLPAFSIPDNIFLMFPVGWVWEQPSRLLAGIPFAATLMLILLAHELGHYLYCLRNGVNATLPFFIPAPTLIGTLGAFIRIKSPIRSRSALFDIGIAGPIAGFVVAVIVLLFALGLSKPLAPGTEASDIVLGYPLIFRLLHWVLANVGLSGPGRIPLEHAYLHPTAIAAWVGMFATALNLLPGGQLDGGHIVYSLFPRAHRHVSRMTVVALLTLGVISVLKEIHYLGHHWSGWAGWFLWGLVVSVTGMRHPQVPHWPEPDRRRRLLGLVALAMLVLTFMPQPFYGPALQ